LSQSASVSGLDDADHGIHFDETGYTIFTGSTYDAQNTTNVRKELPESMTIADINLSGGDDVVFEKSSGETDNDGTITIRANVIDREITITINSLGTINY
jgi:hypothetical protein